MIGIFNNGLNPSYSGLTIPRLYYGSVPNSNIGVLYLELIFISPPAQALSQRGTRSKSDIHPIVSSQ